MNRDLRAFYEVIFSRRDVRGEFLPDEIEDEVLSRILYASHHAPSVGFMQPWNFIIIKSPKVKEQVYNIFDKANKEASDMFEGDRKRLYNSLKLQGIKEAPINICITCDRDRAGDVVLGRTHIKEMDIYSTVCAVENLWLSARAEGLGVGWVSIFNEDELKSILKIPDSIIPIAYLCVGRVKYFHTKPELEEKKWAKREPLKNLIYFEQWQNREDNNSLIKQIEEDSGFPNFYKWEKN